MFSRVAAVVGLVVVFAAQRAEACTCAGGPAGDVMEQLQRAKDGADAVFYARVVKNEPTGLDGHYVTTLDVLESFKGTAQGQLKMRSGDSQGDCSFKFEDDGRYLIYAGLTTAPSFATSHCSRSRRVETPDDSELEWLRKGTPLRLALTVQREEVTCAPCDAVTLAKARSGMNEPARDLNEAIDGGEPFWWGGWGRDVVGRVNDGRMFQMRQTPSQWFAAKCRQRVTIRYCREMKVSGRVFCTDPTAEEVLCDENATRSTTFLPTEAMSVVKSCSWREVDRPYCELDSTMQPADGGLPLFRCAPAVFGSEPAGGFVCRVGP